MLSGHDVIKDINEILATTDNIQTLVENFGLGYSDVINYLDSVVFNYLLNYRQTKSELWSNDFKSNLMKVCIMMNTHSHTQHHVHCLNIHQREILSIIYFQQVNLEGK